MVADPKPDCVGATNEHRWERTPGGLTLTPVEDCHGTQPLVLTEA